MKLPWVLDPKTKEQSVSLTLTVVFCITALTINILKAVGQIQEVAGVNELFYSCLALYFSRRNLSFGGKVYTAQEAESIKGKIE